MHNTIRCILAGGFIGLLLSACNLFAKQTVDAGLPTYQPERVINAGINSIGDDAMGALMSAWLAGFQKIQPDARQGARWEHVSSASAFSALMFEIADIAPLSREPLPSELAPYAHQFKGDMMKSPLLVHVADIAGRRAYLAVNKRPDSPLPPKIKEFISFALSRQGQEIVARQDTFRALTAAEAAQERAALQGYVATLDPGLPSYQSSVAVSGEIRSVGSDGMKSLMDGWMRDFRHVQPGVRTGERWEHLGTLNGFQALIANETDLAPMGREMWPIENAGYKATQGQNAPFEIRVARGGFNTPQRTTAQAVFVHESNPLKHIGMPQLAAILGQPQTITRWGQLGLKGEWADRPISIHMPPRIAPNAMSMQMMVLKGAAWNDAVREAPIAETARAIADNPGAIGFGGFEEGGAGIRTLAVGSGDLGPFHEGNSANASSGRYPLTRYMYIRVNRKPGEPLPASTKEFLRYVLSREGQEPILYSGYFPLTAEEAKQELARLE
jgi:ABC-type phosphate transport system substrate-binding protein